MSGDVNFTVVYPAGLLLPTMASAQLFTGDGYVFEWEIPEEREAGEIYEIGFNRSVGQTSGLGCIQLKSRSYRYVCVC